MRKTILAVLLAPMLHISAAVAADAEEVISLKQATERALELFGGEIIKTETAEQNGRSVFKIRLVSEGRVKEVLIDSLSGEVIKPETE